MGGLGLPISQPINRGLFWPISLSPRAGAAHEKMDWLAPYHFGPVHGGPERVSPLDNTRSRSVRMSTTRGSGAGNGGVVQPIPAGSRKVVQSLKEIVNCPEAEIYATLKECNMDPNEAVNRLLSQDPFHEVKSKREKKKEGKDNSEPRSRGANYNSNRGSKTGADRHLGRGASAPYYASEPPSHGKSTYKKENGSGPYTSSFSSAPGVSGYNRSRGTPGLSDDYASAESKGTLSGTAGVTPSVAQPASGPAWVGIPGQVSMADIVRMGRPNKKGSYAPNASHHNVQDHFTNESSLHTDHAPKVDEWPSIEKPPAPDVILAPEHPVESELHQEASGVSYDNIDYHSEAEEVQEEEEEEEDDDNFESSGGNEVGSVSISSRMIPEGDSRGASLFENELYKNMGSYQPEAHDYEHHEVDEVGASVGSVTRNMQQLSVSKDDRGFASEGNAPSVVIPDHLQVQTADCSHLSFGSFGSAMGAPYSSGTNTSGLEKTNLEEAHNEADNSSAGHPETRHSEYYVDESLGNAPDGSLLHRNGANVGSYEASPAPQQEELRPESADVAHGNQYAFPSSNAGYTFDDAQRLNAALNQTSSQMQNLAPFSNVMHPYTNSLPSSLLAANAHPTRESDLQYSPFPQSMSAKYGNSVSSIGASAISMSEALKTAGLSSSQPGPQALSGTNVATGPPLPQHLAVHPYSQPTLPLGPFANMIGYPFLPQSYTYMPSAFQQSFAGGSNYHQSLAAVLPQYKSSVSVSSLPPQSAGVASGYGGGFGNSATIPGNYSMNPPPAAAPSATNLSYDDVLSSQYKDNTSHLLSLQQQQNENSASWLHGPNSRTMPAVPASAYYNYQTQNQQPGGFRQVQQQQSQNYGNPSYPNFYHSQTGISLDQQQNPRDGSLGGSQGQQPKQSQMWPNNY
ncbi:hypothetical protein PHJA_001633800 [Phtheirospermum japonicum]|uniref:GBF-interacting protein 1 N-terminal domain-containing protein n=1 Tax=Phtheirospermum japonicum TaxID=374723 RepID=A0A830CEZ4_9LAMI|nr:hypothetical protein PHJA_001633800 [Phtheirospermum japonicum]